MTSFFHQLTQVTESIGLPETYHQIHRLMIDSTADIEDFAVIIRRDDRLSAKLLRLANSSYFGIRDDIDEISTVINLLGTQQVYSMILGLSAISSLSSQQIPRDLTNAKTLWRSNLLCANLAQLLAQRLEIQPADRMFIVGLLHDIGHLVLYANFPDLARQAIELVEHQGLTIHQAEQQIQGCHYGDIGAMLIQHWQLPADFQQMVRYQPTPALAPENWVETALLHIAHAHVSQHLELTHQPVDRLIENYAWDITRLDPSAIDQDLQKAIDISADMENAIID